VSCGIGDPEFSDLVRLRRSSEDSTEYASEEGRIAGDLVRSSVGSGNHSGSPVLG